MAAITTNTAMDEVLTTYLNRRFITDLDYTLQFQKFTMKGDLVDNAGNIVRFTSFAAPGRTGYQLGSTPITEGDVNANQIVSLTMTGTEMTLQEYGEHIKISRLYERTAQPGTRERISKRLLDGAAVALDTVVRTAAGTSTNIIYAIATAGAAQAAAPAAVTALGAAAIMFGRKTLFDNLAVGFKGIPGHRDNHFAAILTPKQILDVTSEVTAGRITWANCNVNVPGPMGQEKWVNGYVGSIYGVAVYETNNYATIATSTIDIGYMLSDGGLGSVTIGDSGAQVIVNDVNSPYKNSNSIAWHANFAANIMGGVGTVRVVKIYSLS